jgi:hypothetical protein
MEDQWRPMFRFAQVNQGVMQHNVAGERMRSRIVGMLSVLAAPGASAVKQFEARLAVFAVILGSAPFLFDMDLDEGERADVALEVAAKLVTD